MTGLRFSSFGAATMPLSKIVIDKDLDMGAYAVKADSVKVGSISEKIAGNGVSIDSGIAFIGAPVVLHTDVDGVGMVFGLDENRPTITASETAIYSKSYAASLKKTEVVVSCVIPEFLSGSINLYYSGNSLQSPRQKGYKFYKNDVLLEEDIITGSGTKTGSLDVNVVEGDTLKIIGYGSGLDVSGGTSFTISYRGDITDGAASPTFTPLPDTYPAPIPFTVDDIQ